MPGSTGRRPRRCCMSTVSCTFNKASAISPRKRRRAPPSIRASAPFNEASARSPRKTARPARAPMPASPPFNEASARSPRKTGLSGGRGGECIALQRSLGEIAEEDRTARRSRRRARYSFNEASARSPRKTRVDDRGARRAGHASTRPRRDRRGRLVDLLNRYAPTHELQRGLGEIAEEDKTSKRSSPSGRTRFNEASARSPRNTRHAGTRGGRGRIASTRPRRDRRGRRGGTPPDTLVLYYELQRGLGEIAEEDGERARVALHHVLASTRPRRDRRGRSPRCRPRAAPSEPASTRPRRDRRGRRVADGGAGRHGAAASTRPRRDRRGRPPGHGFAPSPNARFNEASARSPRKTLIDRDGQRRIVLASTRPRRDRRGRHGAAVRRRRQLDRASTRPRRDRRGRLLKLTEPKLKSVLLQRGLGEIAEEDDAVDPRIERRSRASTRPRRDRRGRPALTPTNSVSEMSTLQRGLGEIAEEDCRRPSPSAGARACFNEASARSPRKTRRCPCRHALDQIAASTRPRRDRRGRPC